jgi:hypothetical protein
MAVAMKNAVFWDVTSCWSCVNRHFGGTCRLHLQKNPWVRNHILEDDILHNVRKFPVWFPTADTNPFVQWQSVSRRREYSHRAQQHKYLRQRTMLNVTIMNRPLSQTCRERETDGCEEGAGEKRRRTWDSLDRPHYTNCSSNMAATTGQWTPATRSVYIAGCCYIGKWTEVRESAALGRRFIIAVTRVCVTLCIHRNILIILRTVLYGCETLSLRPTMREEQITSAWKQRAENIWTYEASGLFRILLCMWRRDIFIKIYREHTLTVTIQCL